MPKRRDSLAQWSMQTMCNCNNPGTKATDVKRLCSSAGGKAVSGYFFDLDPVSQTMVR